MKTKKYSDYKLVRVPGAGDCNGCEFDSQGGCMMPEDAGWPIDMECGDVKNNTQLVYKLKD